ncbi:MAG TPA: M23 family metallopeptidase [Gammaproteobacteria bacterium]|jgi:murein DD-endopeptidase MepM/ murein hydrolase activator NlpD
MAAKFAALSDRARRRRWLVGLCLGLASACASAQQLYKYRDADGGWVYSDRQPAPGIAVESIGRAAAAEEATVRVVDVRRDGGVVLVAENTYHSPAQLAVRITLAENFGLDVPTGEIFVLPARSESELMRLPLVDTAAEGRLEYQFQYLPGDPAARHEPPAPYRLPYAQATRYPVSQAYPDQFTHTDPSSWHAIDFEMPIGTGIYAARGGIVTEVASNFRGAGTDLEIHGAAANFIRILHDDGTMALYAHLNSNSVRVVPGENVVRGQYIADSGNTGFTSGPHLHFVVQRNRDGAIVSVPVEFAAIDGSAIVLNSGDVPAAY